MYTSSTAQGVCGSFKDRKPIGEVRCLDGRANPLMDRTVFGASAFLFDYLSACLTKWLTDQVTNKQTNKQTG